MLRLSMAKRVQVISALVEGCSVRATSRLTGVAKGTILRLLADTAAACDAYQQQVLRQLPCKRIQLDEIWSFVYAKAKNVPEEMRGAWGVGDVWTWVALCADTKLAVSWRIGRRDAATAHGLIRDLAARLAHRVQLTSDGHKVYLEAVEAAFGANVDYAMLVKMYEGDSGQRAPAEQRYSPARVSGAQKQRITGNPDMAHVSTSYVERQNLTMQMQMRRFTRLTNAFSKKIENHARAISLFYMWYNFVRIHQTLRVTPAMEAGVSDHVWSIEDMVALADRAAAA